MIASFEQEPIAANATARAGRGHLEVRRVDGQSAIVSACATSPLKLLTPCSRGASAWACLSSFGGGLVAGDRNEFDIQLGRKARCYLGTQASTKVYRNPASLPCGHWLRAGLDAGSLLVLAPDPVQAFAGSSYVQDQVFHLKSDASLMLLDWSCAGRVARGERWAFGSFQSRNEVFIDGERAFLDALCLDGTDGLLAGAGRMGRFNVIATLILIGPLLEECTRMLLEEVQAKPVTRRAQHLLSASPIRGGAMLRVAAETVEQAGRELHRHIQRTAELLGDDPWERKW